MSGGTPRLPGWLGVLDYILPGRLYDALAHRNLRRRAKAGVGFHSSIENWPPPL